VRTESALNLSRLGKQEGKKQQREQSLDHPGIRTLTADPAPGKVFRAAVAAWAGRTLHNRGRKYSFSLSTAGAVLRGGCLGRRAVCRRSVYCTRRRRRPPEARDLLVRAPGDLVEGSRPRVPFLRPLRRSLLRRARLRACPRSTPRDSGCSCRSLEPDVLDESGHSASTTLVRQWRVPRFSAAIVGGIRRRARKKNAWRARFELTLPAPEQRRSPQISACWPSRCVSCPTSRPSRSVRVRTRPPVLTPHSTPLRGAKISVIR
jgi:hypothetical protein